MVSQLHGQFFDFLSRLAKVEEMGLYRFSYQISLAVQLRQSKLYELSKKMFRRNFGSTKKVHVGK